MASTDTSTPAPAPTAVPVAPVAKKEDDRDRGIARIKKEYLVDVSAVEVGSGSGIHRIDDDAAESGTSTAQPDARDARDGDRGAKRRKTNGGGKGGGGQNKNRQFPQVRDRGPKMCRSWELKGECDRPTNCRFAHTWEEYFKTKPQDIHHDPQAGFTVEPPYIQIAQGVSGGDDIVGMRLDTTTICPVKKDLGWCPYGMKCRFLGNHLTKVDAPKEGESAGPANEEYAGWRLTDHIEPAQKEGWRQGETNWQNPEVIRQLRSQSYEYKYSKEYIRRIEPHKAFYHDQNRPTAPKAPAIEMDEEEAFNDTADGAASVTAAPPSQIPGESEAMDVPLRAEEKKRLNWENGLYLAPLTTVGNLPFRRLCIDYGATITCSEMALSQQLITGQNDEWALVRRHESEKHFGVQVAGGYPNIMVPTAEMIGRELKGGVDFVDVNLGCPIDLVFNQGAGSALMDSAGRLGKILVGMNRALGEIPLTVKFRTGVASGKNNAHKLIPRFVSEWGASALTLHGRSRQQRYSKLADWAYIKQCATTLRATVADNDMAPIPIFGNGDCFSAQQYYEEKEASGVDGVMVARGALIKPWIFTEIKERREWDITGTERLEGIRKFAEFGLSHWGSDTQGINTTRRFLLEALSFQHRYVPIGLLERLPAQMNERPPAFRGRNELETLLSSPNSDDWVKISEMFLGKVGDEYKFTPKHKTNSYGSEEAQG